MSHSSTLNKLCILKRFVTSRRKQRTPQAIPQAIPQVINFNQRFGNWSQIASVILALLTLLIVYDGVRSTVPFFQVKILSEQKARLTYEMGELRAKAWNMTCSFATVKATSDLDLFHVNSQDIDRLAFLAQPSTTYRLAISDGLANADLAVLAPDDEEHLKAFARDYVKSLSGEYDAPVSSRMAEFNLVDKMAKQLKSACESASPIRN